ncbi:MAG: hypothetical protein AAF984_05025 [Verrucomicrobiota bacterium]
MADILTYKILFPFVFIVIAIFFFVIPFQTLAHRKPFVLSARWLFGATCVCFIPAMIHPIYVVLRTEYDIPPFMWLSPLFYIVLIFVFWVQMRGYFFFGVTDALFREAILSSSKNLGLSIEETISRLVIKETKHELNVVVQGWVGIAQLKAASSGADTSATQIANEMKRYFNENKGKMNLISSFLYLISSFFMLAIALFLFSL